MAVQNPTSEHRERPADGELVRLVAGGDRAAFEELIHRHQQALYRFAVRMVGPEADDALQDALLSVWRSAGTFRGEASVRTWLFQVVVNACHRRSRRRAGEPDPSPPTREDEGGADPQAAAPDAVAHAREVGRALAEALASLSPEAREVLVLRDVEGLAGEEVAQVLGLGLPAMKSRLHRARLELKQSVEERLGQTIQEALS